MNNYQQFSPQYFQQQFDSQMQTYNNLYNQNRNIANANSNGFVGQYVNSYEEVEKGQVNINGIPTMYVANGVFWIKKFVNGQAYINAYRFEPMNNTGAEPQPQQQVQNQNTGQNKHDFDTFMQAVSKSLDEINNRLNLLEKKE